MATKEAVVSARLDQRLKQESETILKQLGLSTTEAIRMFFTQITLNRGLPFSALPAAHRASADADDLLLPAAKRSAAVETLYDD